MNNNSEKWALIIDDLEGMRSQLRMALTNCGFAKLHVASNINDAIKRMEKHHYDIILCDYSLGDGTDGQQFLEYLRAEALISHNTIFVMITAEHAYEKVVTASECTPDDYLLKPFTAAQFDARLQKLFEKQAFFSIINHARDSKDWPEVIVECDKKMVVRDKYYCDLCRIKANALEKDWRAKDAEQLYLEVLESRPLGWAKLGLARVLSLTDRKGKAISLLREVVAEFPKFMAAYDLLGQMLAVSGDKQGALDILQKAREVSPGTMSRIRELSSLAVENGKPEIAEKIMKQALHQHKYSPVRQANDFAMLSKALIHQSKTSEALGLVVEAQKSFRDPHSNALLAASESIAHQKAGNSGAAKTAIERAMSTDINILSADTLIALAEACLATGREADANGFLNHLIQNNQEDEGVLAKVHSTLVAAGRDPSEAKAMIESSKQEIVLLNNEGVRKAKAGQLQEAVDLLCHAAARLPNNMQIVGNAALTLALDLQRNGILMDKLELCVKYRTILANRAPDSPKLRQIDSLLEQIN